MKNLLVAVLMLRVWFCAGELKNNCDELSGIFLATGASAYAKDADSIFVRMDGNIGFILRVKNSHVTKTKWVEVKP